MKKGGADCGGGRPPAADTDGACLESGRTDKGEKQTGLTNFTYLLRCADGTYYCGWTNHLAERVRTHNAGRGARYTMSRRPVTLVYWEAFATKQEAMRREAAVKRLTHAQKQALAEGFGGLAEEAGGLCAGYYI